jgi:hypothetical protein
MREFMSKMQEGLNFLLQKFLRPIRILWSMIGYLWKELKLYLPSIEMKASYIMEF